LRTASSGSEADLVEAQRPLHWFHGYARDQFLGTRDMPAAVRPAACRPKM